MRQPGAGAVATALLAGAVTAPGPTTVDADDWIEHEDAKNYCVVEDCVRSSDSILSMIWWKDESQIVDLQGDD
ncbi:MAG: hypothetical protein HY898_35035 [Deltaproteobacteria bacterium]|nr:hypothetical protein [Deltaproteobacteria bacterium]